jgi:site-specific recombinase XerD
VTIATIPAPAQRQLRQCGDREDLQRGADAEQQVSVLRRRARSFEGGDRQELTKQHDNPAGALVHALRHSFASLAIEYGTDVAELRELLGHASLATTSRYLDATTSRLRDAVAAHPSQRALDHHR